MNNRTHKCKLVLEHEQKMNARSNGEQNGEPNVDQPYTNDQISLDYDEKKGRKLVANGSIQMGECLIKETAFASIVNSDYYLAFCNHCLTQLNGYGIPCNRCDYAIYCSEQCLNDASYHTDECGKVSDLVNQLGVGYLVLRLAFKVGFDEMIQSVEDDSSGDFRGNYRFNNSNKLTSTYRDVHNLMTHQDEFELKENLSFALVALFFRQLLDSHSRYTFTHDKSAKLCRLFLHHIQQLSTNLISIDQHVALDVYDNCGVEMNEKLKIGIGFYPITSLLNHSCVPNVIPKFKGNRLEISALKLIEKQSGSYIESYS